MGKCNKRLLRKIAGAIQGMECDEGYFRNYPAAFNLFIGDESVFALHAKFLNVKREHSKIHITSVRIFLNEDENLIYYQRKKNLILTVIPVNMPRHNKHC